MLTSPAQVQHLAASPHYPCLAPAWRGVFTNESILGIHQTGQTQSYAEGDDGAVQFGVVLPQPRFTDNGDGTITDNLTGLIWTKDVGCMEPASWDEAHEMAGDVAAGDCGLTDGSKPGDWRVPNIRELHSLVDFGNHSPSLPSGHPFEGIDPATSWWSSTTSAMQPETFAYTVNLENGEVIAMSKDFKAGCLALR